MDEMERVLRKLPARNPPPELTGRVVAAFHRRYRRRQMLQLGLSTAMVLAGVLLFAPWALGYLASISLPDSGLPLFVSAFSMPSDSLVTVSRTWTGLNLLQSSISQTLGSAEAAGLVLLVAGALLGIDPLLPRAPQEPRLRSF